MKDILHELQGLSLKLQWRDMSLVDATCQIQQTTDVLTGMKESGGKSTLKAEQCTSWGLFKDVQVVEGKGKINCHQFYQSVIDGLKRWMLESDFIQMLKPLEKHFWPQDRNALILYEENEIRTLAKKLGESAIEAVDEFRNSKLQNKPPGKTLEKLCTASRTYLPSPGGFWPSMTLTAIDCVRTASHHSFLWTLMDPLWRDSTQHLPSHPGLNQVIACPHHRLLDQQQRNLIPGLYGCFCFMARAILGKSV